MPKPICLITGATDGVGRATAAELVAKGFTVVLAARNAAKAEAVKAGIAGAGSGEVGIILADLTSLMAVRRLAETFKTRYARLDVLINNAGVFMPARKLTEDGFEATYQINYLSGFLLTQLLLEPLLRSRQGRIINLTSSVYALGRFDEANLQSEKGYSVFGAYSASKLFVLLSSLEQAKRLSRTAITVNAMHPGVVRHPNDAARAGRLQDRLLAGTAFRDFPAEGRRPFGLSRDLTEGRLGDGPIFRGRQSGRHQKQLQHPATRRRLWEVSVSSLRDRRMLDE
jgi:NAD(P)-dependent dehydrogenase (short-subunit alcohol dehydrogenase family)